MAHSSKLSAQESSLIKTTDLSDTTQHFDSLRSESSDSTKVALSNRKKWSDARTAYKKARSEEKKKHTEAASKFYEQTLQLLESLDLASIDLPTTTVTEFQRQILKDYNHFLETSSELAEDSISLIKPTYGIKKSNDPSNYGSKDSLAVQTFMFNYGTIPFRQTEDSVLALLAGATIEESNCDASFIRLFKLSEYFKGGVYGSYFTSYSFLTDITKCYVVKCKEWENIASITLYFTKPYKLSTPFRLFMVIKSQKESHADRKTVFREISEQITTKMGSPLIVKDIQCQTSDMVLSGTSQPGKIGLWNSQNSRVFLLLYDMFWPVFNSINPTIVYLDKIGWKSYVEDCKTYDAEKSKENKQKLKKSF